MQDYGARAVLAARGEILTAPAEKGDIRVLSKTTDVVERDPAWSPDGKSIAYLSDESGEYALHVRDQTPAEKGDIRVLSKTTDVVERDPAWSPDGKSTGSGVVSGRKVHRLPFGRIGRIRFACPRSERDG